MGYVEHEIKLLCLVPFGAEMALVLHLSLVSYQIVFS